MKFKEAFKQTIFYFLNSIKVGLLIIPIMIIIGVIVFAVFNQILPHWYEHPFWQQWVHVYKTNEKTLIQTIILNLAMLVSDIPIGFFAFRGMSKRHPEYWAPFFHGRSYFQFWWKWFLTSGFIIFPAITLYHYYLSMEEYGLVEMIGSFTVDAFILKYICTRSLPQTISA